MFTPRGCKEKVLVSWSSGKDSALALYQTLIDPSREVAGLLTTVLEDGRRIGMHGAPQTLLERQAEALDLPLEMVWIPPADTDDEEYKRRLRAALSRQMAAGVTTVVFGDIYLADLRRYREVQLAKIGLKAGFPLWGRDPRALVETFVAQGFKAVIVNVNGAVLSPAFLGRTIDASFLADLPAGVDPCGEKGEYHSFVYDGPIFDRRIPFALGDVSVTHERFYNVDLAPVDPGGEDEIPIVYRPPCAGEEPAVAALIEHTFDRFIAPEYSAEGIQEFFQYANAAGLRRRAGDRHFVLLAVAGDAIVGMIEMRDWAHIALLFVDAGFQRQGIASGLFQRALLRCRREKPDLQQITVNSSPYAVPVYERWGFHAMDVERVLNGIRFVPMERPAP